MEHDLKQKPVKSKIKFPAIVLDQNEMIHGFKKERDFVITDRDEAALTPFLDSTIIDCHGNVLTLVHVEQHSWKNPISGFALWLKGKARIFPQVVFKEKIDYDQLQMYLYGVISDHPEMWSAYGGKNECLNALQECNSLREILLMFAETQIEAQAA